MIAILTEEKYRHEAEAIFADLEETYRGQLEVQIFAASSPEAWRESPSWDDLLIVLFDSAPLSDKAIEFVEKFLQSRGEHRLILPVSMEDHAKAPPRPIDTVKALRYDERARGPLGRIVRRVGAMLGLKLRRQDNKILVSYRATEGTYLANQIHEHLSSLGYNVWLDEAKDPIDGEPTILPGTEVQEQIQQALESANLLLLLDTPSAPQSGWIKYEIDSANATLLPILPVCFRQRDDRRKGPRFRSLRDLQRWVNIDLPDDDKFLDEAELAQIVDELESYLSDIFRRKCRVPFIVEREFVSRHFAWASVDKRLFVYESSKQHTPRVKVRVLSHCSFFDQIFLPALKRVAEFLAAAGGANYSLYVYDGELLPEPQLRELIAESDATNVEKVIVLHHQELAALIDSNFTMLPS